MSETNFNGQGRAVQGDARLGTATSSGRKPRQFHWQGVEGTGKAWHGEARLLHWGESPNSFHRRGEAWLGADRLGGDGRGYIIAPSGATVYLN